ncbi:hypothetical protein HZC31_01925 [Candidatus Woesearchaeota archaeon]|nr:hypothetical protein [Candidatus Woesearchaeota archaeon]
MKPTFQPAKTITTVPPGYVAVVRDLGVYRDSVVQDRVAAFPFCSDIAFVSCSPVQQEERIQITTKDARHVPWKYALEWTITNPLAYMKTAPEDVEQQLVRISEAVIQRVISGEKTLDDLLHHHKIVAEELNQQLSESIASRNWGISPRFLLTQPYFPGVAVDEVEGLRARLEQVYPLLQEEVTLDVQLARSRLVGEAEAYRAAKTVELEMSTALIRELATARAQGAEAFAAVYKKYIDALSTSSQKLGTSVDPMILGYAFLSVTEHVFASSGVEGTDPLLQQMKQRLDTLCDQRMEGKGIAAKAEAAGIPPLYAFGADTAVGIMRELKGVHASTTDTLDTTLQRKYGIGK